VTYRPAIPMRGLLENPNPGIVVSICRNAALLSSWLSNHAAARAVHRCPDGNRTEGLAAAPVARQTGRVAQCPLTGTNSCL
jgi:hypothetical protein